MFELKWTDDDMINFAQRFTDHVIDVAQLDDYREDLISKAFKERVEELVSKVKDNPELLSQIENIVNSK